MYPKDDRGEYQCLHRWIDAWADQIAGYVICEARRYADGEIVIWQSPPTYLHDTGEHIAHMHAIYRIAARGLGL